jgi:NhaP-type Na+/H+ or K+/H+ antiporter
MALSVPMTVAENRVEERDWMLTATYVVVAFSVLVQGTTVGSLMRRWLSPNAVSSSKSPHA